MSVLSDHEYLLTSQALNRMAGLVFDESRRAAVSAIVSERIAEVGSTSVTAYLDLVQSVAGAPERQKLLDAVTIQETHFFRNLPQVDALRRHIVPELLAHASASRRPLTVWSAGCSTGEEPYTLAMLLLEATQGRPVPVRIVGTDVSSAALDVARAARYSGRTIDLAETGAADRWFDQQDDGSRVVKKEVRELVEFRLHNLVTEAPPFGHGDVDLLVCRNVTIYFARETTQALVHRFHGVMRDGAYLVLGHAETLWQVSDAFSLVPVGEAFVYRRDPVSVRPPGPRPTPAAGRVVPPAGRSRAPLAATRREPPPKQRARLRAPVRVIRSLTSAPALPSAADLPTAREALADGRYTDAVDLAAAISAREPLLVEAYVVQGRALANLGRDAEAVDHLRKAVFLDPTAGHAHFMLASSLLRLDEAEAASLSFAAAADTLPLTTPGAVADLLDGRPVAELVDLCRQLAAAGRGTGRELSTNGHRPASEPTSDDAAEASMGRRRR